MYCWFAAYAFAIACISFTLALRYLEVLAAHHRVMRAAMKTKQQVSSQVSCATLVSRTLSF